MRTNWKTTVGGVACALGAAFSAVFLFGDAPQWIGMLGAGFSAFGATFIGLMAKDK